MDSTFSFRTETITERARNRSGCPDILPHNSDAPANIVVHSHKGVQMDLARTGYCVNLPDHTEDAEFEELLWSLQQRYMLNDLTNAHWGIIAPMFLINSIELDRFVCFKGWADTETSPRRRTALLG